MIRAPQAPLPGADCPLTPAELDEAWGESPRWALVSDQRLVISLLDAHGGTLDPAACRALAQTRWLRSLPEDDKAQFLRRGMPVRVGEDGRWILDREHPTVRPARVAVRDRIADLRRRGEDRPEGAVFRALQLRAERKREAHAAELAGLRRLIVHAYPATRPEALVLLDITRRELTTHLGDQLPEAISRIAPYDFLLGVQIRGLLQSLGFDPGARRLGELGPPQKTIRLNR